MSRQAGLTKSAWEPAPVTAGAEGFAAVNLHQESRGTADQSHETITMKQALTAAIVRQFGQPRGIAGRLAGWLMANRSSNRERNSWVVSLLDVKPSQRVLEIGFGPGLAIAELSQRVGTAGHVYGIDHSEEMLRAATRRNASAIASGRVTLCRASVDQLPKAIQCPMDAILSVNSLGFWPDPTRRLEELRRRLRPGGRIAIASQPRVPGTTAESSASEIASRLKVAGYAHIRTEVLGLNPPVACVLGINSWADR